MIPEDIPGWLLLIIAIAVFAIGILLWVQAQNDYQQYRPEQEKGPVEDYGSRQRRVPRQFLNAVGAILLGLYLLVVAWQRL